MSLEEASEAAAVLEATALKAANTYYDNAVKFGLGKYPKDVKKGVNWKKFVNLARRCIAKHVDPETFVNAAYAKAIDRHPIVMVTDVCSANFDEVLAREDADTLSSPRDLWNLLSCKLVDMVFMLDGIHDRIELLDDPAYGFPAWFRVFSPKDPVNAIIVHWGDLAYDELKANPALNDFLLKKRPVTHQFLSAVISAMKKEQSHE